MVYSNSRSGEMADKKSTSKTISPLTDVRSGAMPNKAMESSSVVPIEPFVRTKIVLIKGKLEIVEYK